MHKYLLILLFFFLGLINLTAQNADINILKKINLGRNEKLDPTFKFLTQSIVPVELGAPLTMLLIGIIKKDSVVLYKGFYVAESIAVATFVTFALKYSISRDRPFVTYPEIENVTGAGPYSFPSGHTSTAFSLATSMSISFPKWYVIAPTFLWAGSVGYSRMHLGVHYPSDVLAGAIIGAGSSYLCHLINKKVFYNKREKTAEMSINLW